jgi:hypothetical protein
VPFSILTGTVGPTWSRRSKFQVFPRRYCLVVASMTKRRRGPPNKSGETPQARHTSSPSPFVRTASLTRWSRRETLLGQIALVASWDVWVGILMRLTNERGVHPLGDLSHQYHIDSHIPNRSSRAGRPPTGAYRGSLPRSQLRIGKCVKLSLLPLPWC